MLLVKRNSRKKVQDHLFDLAPAVIGFYEIFSVFHGVLLSLFQGIYIT